MINNALTALAVVYASAGVLYWRHDRKASLFCAAMVAFICGWLYA